MKNIVLHNASSDARLDYQDRNVNVSSEKDVNVIDENYNSVTKDSNIAENNELFNFNAKFHARDKKIRSRNSDENTEVNLSQ